MDSDRAALLHDDAELVDRLTGSAEVERLAVLATFDPARLHGADGADIVRLLCRQLAGARDSAEVILRERYRVGALAGVLHRSGPVGLSMVRRSLHADRPGPLQRVLDAVVDGQHRLPVDEDDENDLLAALEVLRWTEQAFAQAGLERPEIEPSPEAIRARLALLDTTHAVRRLVSGGVVGRDAELDRLHAYRTSSATSTLTGDPAMVVYGIGGVGKSTLVARFVIDLYEGLAEDGRWAWAYVDLDRPTLASADPLVVLNDIIAQVGAQFPEHQRVLRRVRDVAYLRTKGAGLEAEHGARSARARAVDFAGAFAELGAESLVVVVDTFEELERRDAGRAAALHDLFTTLSSSIAGFRLVVSGRRPAEAFVDPDRRDRRLHVEPLTDGAAAVLLRRLVAASGLDTPPPEVPDHVADEIVGLVGGSPLTIRLAARVLVREGPGAVTDAVARARTMGRLRVEFVRGFLYQRILDHIDVDDPDRTQQLRQIARAGLALRRITHDLVEQVLVPVLDLVPPPPTDEIMTQLAAEVALVEAEGGGLRLREDLRTPALAALRLTRLDLVEQVHRRAVGHFVGLSHPDAREELAYHRLALGLVDVEYDAATLRALEPSVGDLPPAAAELVHGAWADPAAVNAIAELTRWEHGVLAEGERALASGDLAHVRSLLAGRSERTTGSELHALESRLEEASGDLEAAVHAARRELAAAAAVRHADRRAAAAVRVSGLFEGLGAISEAAEALTEVAADPLLSGRPDLGLELLLNHMTLRERRARLDEDDRWSSGLGVRSLLQRADTRVTATHGAVIRLLAAALGREEPERIRTAVRQVGLGFDEDDQRVAALAATIAAWDAATAEPGSVARAAGLNLASGRNAGLDEVWSTISGLGTEAGSVLDAVWAASPPIEVREAFRQIYLWWGFPAASEERMRGSVEPMPEASIDWTNSAVRDLEEILLTVYRTNSVLQRLAVRAGLDGTTINWSNSPRLAVREVMAQAEAQGLLPALVQAILGDGEARATHQRVRALLDDADFVAWVDRQRRSATGTGTETTTEPP